MLLLDLLDDVLFVDFVEWVFCWHGFGVGGMGWLIK